MLLFGTRHFGKVDEVPGHFHVATRCHHLWYFPLIPLDSWIFVDDTRRFSEVGGEWTADGVRLPSIRWNSVAVAWLRWGLVYAAVIAGVTGLAGLPDVLFDGTPARTTLVRLGAAAAFLGALALSQRLSRASAARAIELRQTLGLPEECASRDAVPARD